MNKVILIGRLCENPEVRYSQGETQTAIAKYRLAVDRKYKREGDTSADFINCLAFGKQGEFAEKYLSKGTKIAAVGRIQTGSYTNRDGQKVYTTDVVVEEHYFCESKSSRMTEHDSDASKNAQATADGFSKVPDDIDDLPFL